VDPRTPHSPAGIEKPRAVVYAIHVASATDSLQANRSPLHDQAGPIRLAAICAALTKNYEGWSNQPSPGSVASAKCLGPHKVADVLWLGGFGFITASLAGLAEICWSAYYPGFRFGRSTLPCRTVVAP
jgi:hypothetical protein